MEMDLASFVAVPIKVHMTQYILAVARFLLQSLKMAQDPAVEEVHEKKMFDLQMGNGPTTHYFQELETQAMLASLHNDDEPPGSVRSEFVDFMH
ncbi:uncharacterized protein ARMOST_09955 [Armillaria ostoyae]|uniref:Uncharacterized protein n=1 Tax=Armillaria ostoyae TaxID=47428 RepID=A0A284RCY3_ARMOS|nr:uncharacterized protein ARMOST_09955 [Armillaria ostoyae]